MISLQQIPSLRGVILFEGRSLIDGCPIVAIATLQSSNKKTGNMVQTWILRQDVPPLEALKNGGDISICGDCKHRKNPTTKKRSCYVNVGQAPNQIYRSYKKGLYPLATKEDLKAIASFRLIRLGAYGDPYAVPCHIWDSIVKPAKGNTGYTHQWHKSLESENARHCMASVDNLDEYEKATSQGWRTFRVLKQHEKPHKDEIICPATKEGGNGIKHLITCSDCLLCCGNKKNAKNVAVYVHGSGATNFK